MPSQLDYDILRNSSLPENFTAAIHGLVTQHIVYHQATFHALRLRQEEDKRLELCDRTTRSDVTAFTMLLTQHHSLHCQTGNLLAEFQPCTPVRNRVELDAKLLSVHARIDENTATRCMILFGECVSG